MGTQRSRLSKIWVDPQTDLAVAQLDPPLRVGPSGQALTYERPLATRAVRPGDLILMVGASPNGGTVTDTRPSRYAWLPVSSTGPTSYTVDQTQGNPINTDPNTGNVRICTYGDSGGENILYEEGDAKLAGITVTASGLKNGYFAQCSSVDVFSRSSFIKPLIADKKVIYFAPSWNIPYDNNAQVWKTFNPCDNKCFKIDYKYEFEQGYDVGHVQVMPENTLTVHTGTGTVSRQMCGNVTFAVISDNSVQKRGFYDVVATCN
jgi:hypothetical protein